MLSVRISPTSEINFRCALAFRVNSAHSVKLVPVRWLGSYSQISYLNAENALHLHTVFAYSHTHIHTAHHMWEHVLEYAFISRLREVGKHQAQQFHNDCRCACTSARKLSLRLWPRFRASLVEKMEPNICSFTLHSFSSTD